MVSTHSRLKAAGKEFGYSLADIKVSTHSRLKAAGFIKVHLVIFKNVSTHSRLKAAGIFRSAGVCRDDGFNTQPPEGGWFKDKNSSTVEVVSTHSRLKAAGVRQ